jgi:hypothetical protein
MQESASNRHPIDKKVSDLMAKDQSATGTRNAHYTAYRLWTAEVARLYNTLLKDLPAPLQAPFKSSHASWVAYRRQEEAFVEKLYGNKRGTIWNATMASRNSDIVRQRALDLAEFQEDLDAE